MFNPSTNQPDREPDVLQREAAEVGSAVFAEAKDGTAILAQLEVVRSGIEQQASLDAAEQNNRAAGEVAVSEEVELDESPEPTQPEQNQIIDISTTRSFIESIFRRAA